ncbi:uncharacterized protein DUF4062 [Rathayibacter sp. PhB152]|uniref:DUF4062 domain-containing protein n=1 Tax=Rathayibacter sp. PhB152 TaxID=2485190 RepID=UPI000F4B4063|nr:DUF4062 domain-containing protein [Rathayibacter sp. PhB152]ROQ64230.1 uncharacterized protein DUF4062 [Rathayibacter sp. PhB152]
MAGKYQIFVSSTYGDLKDERDRVIQGVLELGHIPVGMEMFSAADEEQWHIIARHIEESDYYVAIIAHRYGSIVEGISYTRKEYEFALSKGVPVIGFVIDPGAPWPADRIDTDPMAVARLKEFKELIEAKPVGYWRSADDLYGQASVALVKTMAARPRVGWIRATSAVGPEVTAEISRLSAENATLRSQIAELEASSDRGREEELDALWRRLQLSKWEYSVRVPDEKDWMDGEPISMRHMFSVLAPNLVVEATVSTIRIMLLTNTNAKERPEITPLAIPNNHISALVADFMTLDLMEPSTRRHPVSDKNEYWTLTDLGRELMKRRKRIEFERDWSAQERDATTTVEKVGE